jgi:AraC family transcriptional regulator, transcriptional activator of pobA
MQHLPDFTATRLELLSGFLRGKYPLNRQTPHLICLVLKGSGSRSVGLHSFPITDNTLFIVPSRMEHSGEFTGDDLRGFVICFTPELFLNKAFPRRLVEGKAVLNGSLKPNIIPDNEQTLRLCRVMEQLIFEYESGEANIRTDEMVCTKLLELLILCERLFKAGDSGAALPALPQEVVAFQQMLEQEFNRQHSVHYYARRQNLHPGTLNAYVRQHFGLPVKVLINQKLVREAKYLLSLGDLSVKQIAAALGFEDTNYFSYFFKRETGLSPLDYRQSNGPSGV